MISAFTLHYHDEGTVAGDAVPGFGGMALDGAPVGVPLQRDCELKELSIVGGNNATEDTTFQVLLDGVATALQVTVAAGSNTATVTGGVSGLKNQICQVHDVSGSGFSGPGQHQWCYIVCW